MLFPEGARSEGKLASFRAGIGLLVKQSSAPGATHRSARPWRTEAAGRGWFRSGTVEIRIGNQSTSRRSRAKLHHRTAASRR